MPAPLTPEEVEKLSKEILFFILGLAKEGERALVIGGGARLDVALENVLKAVMRPVKEKEEDLFKADRPLGSLSAKIKLAYRLGLIDDNVERALNITRKIRNDFAHSTTPGISLSQQPHADRVREFQKCALEQGEYESLLKGLGEARLEGLTTPPQTVFALALSILIAVLERVARSQDGPLKCVSGSFQYPSPN